MINKENWFFYATLTESSKTIVKLSKYYQLIYKAPIKMNFGAVLKVLVRNQIQRLKVIP